MPNYGSKKQNTGGSKIKDGTSDDYDMGQLNGFGTNKGSRNKRTLVNDNGAGGGKFIDTDNGPGSGDGFGGAPKSLR